MAEPIELFYSPDIGEDEQLLSSNQITTLASTDIDKQQQQQQEIIVEENNEQQQQEKQEIDKEDYKPKKLTLVSPQVTINSKAIAICLVLLGHIIVYGGRKNMPSKIYPLFRFATLAVGVFTFLSGYGLTKSVERSGLDGFFLKRFSTVYIPFAVTAIFFTSLFQNVLYSFQTFKDLLRFLTLYGDPASTIDGTMWFVTFICSWYILFYIVFRILKNKHLRVIAMFILGIGGYIALSKDYGYWRLTDLYTNQMFQIPLGVLFATYENNRFIQKYLKEKKIHIPLLIIHTASVGIIYWKFIYIDVDDTTTTKTYFFNVMQTIINILFGTWVPFLCTCFIKSANPVMDFLGGYSYEAYLLEGIFIDKLKFSANHLENGILFFMVTFACAFSFRRIYQVAIKLTVSFVNMVSEKCLNLLKNIKRRFKK